MVETQIGKSQLLHSKSKLNTAEDQIIKDYLNNNYIQIRENISNNFITNKLVINLFEHRGLRSDKEIIVYRSQTKIFDTKIATNSIISTVIEPEWSDKFGSFIYVFVIAPDVPYLKISWTIGTHKNAFTEIILPPGGYFRKTKRYNFSEETYLFRIKEFTPTPTKNTSIEKFSEMTLSDLTIFRQLPKNKQTKKTLLNLLDMTEEDLDFLSTPAMKAYKEALSKSRSQSQQ